MEPHVGRIEKTVFISYRRQNFPWALCVYQNLTMNGYDVFIDYQSIPSGSFRKVILENIRARAHFLVILTPSALERCKNPDDWLRFEIETAIDENRNIVPLLMEGFDFGSPLVKAALTGKLEVLSSYNALPVPDAYALEAMIRLRERFLNVSLSDVALPKLKPKTQRITETQKAAANKAEEVKEEQLSAQTWFERGYVFQNEGNPEEALRCYSEATRLDSNLVAAYNNLGIMLGTLKRYDEAEIAYHKAIELDPSYASAYSNLGNLLSDNLKRYDEAEAAYRKAIELNPSDTTAYSNLGNLLSDNLKRYDEAEAIYRKAIDLDPSDVTAYNNLVNSLRARGRNEEAILVLEKMIEMDPEDFNPYLALGSIYKQIDRNVTKEIIEKARQFLPEDDLYNLACLESVCDNLDLAFEYLEKAARTNEFDPSWAWRDPDLQWIRDDPRFTEIVGQKPEIIE